MNKRLYRTEEDKMIAGVCGGIAEYFNADPSVVRILSAVAIVFGGLSVWLYIILAIIVPKKSAVMDEVRYNNNSYNSNNYTKTTYQEDTYNAQHKKDDSENNMQNQ